MAWLIAVFALCNAEALLVVRDFPVAGLTAERVARLRAGNLAVANAMALAVALYVVWAPRLGRRTEPGWRRRRANGTLQGLVFFLVWTALRQGLKEPEVLIEAARRDLVWVGVVAALAVTGAGVVVAVRSLRGARPEGP